MLCWASRFSQPHGRQIIQGELTANDTHAYIAWAFALDTNLLEPPDPKKPKLGFRPLRQVQNVVADLFEAHVGALAEEGRETEIAEWVETLLARNRDRLERRAGELLAQAHETASQSRAEVHKRAREDAFTGGCEIGEQQNAATFGYRRL